MQVARTVVEEAIGEHMDGTPPNPSIPKSKCSAGGEKGGRLVQSAKFRACAGERLVSPAWLWRGLVVARVGCGARWFRLGTTTEQTNSGNVRDDRCFVPHFRCDAFQVRMQRGTENSRPSTHSRQRFQ
jgi:hypothetical protein